MANKWVDVSLSDISERIGDGLHGTPTYSDNGEYYFVNGNNLENGEITIKDSTKKVGLEQYLKHKKDINSNAILVSINGTVGNVALYNGEEVVLGKSACYINLKNNIHRDFVAYVLSSHQFQEYIQRCATGSTIKNVSLKMMRDFSFRMPEDETEQIKAVETLKNLDGKISLNRKSNQTLEQMAQALFKSWFVDFDPVIDNALDAGNDIPEALQHKVELRKQAQQLPDFKPLPDDTRALFPREFEQTDEPNIGVAGWIPKGWSISNIEKCCSHIIDHRGKTPKKLGGDWSDSGFAAISAKNVKGGQIVRPDTIRFVDDDLYKKWMKEPLQPKDIIMTSEAPMGEMYFLAEKADYLLSQRLYAMRADIEVTTGEYLNYWLQTTTARADLEGRATGTTVTGIRQVELKKVIVLLPALSTVNKFSKIVEGFLVRKEHNRNQNSNLEVNRPVFARDQFV